MGQVCTKDEPAMQGTNEPTVPPADGGMRPASPAAPDQQLPAQAGTGPQPPARGVSDLPNAYGDSPSIYSSGFGGLSDWTAADSAPPLNAKVAEALKRAKPRSWTNYPDLKEFGSYLSKKLKNTGNEDFYEGHNQRDIPYGWGVLIGKNGDYMEGVFIDGKPARYIRHIDTNGTIYEGEFLLGRNGKGSLIEQNGQVIKCDKWVNGVPQGEITREDTFGKVIFRGISNEKGNQGRCFVANVGFNTEANYQDNVIQGPVTKIYPDGSRYDGAVDATFLEEGQGVLTFSDGRKFEGPFSKGKANGKGKFTTDTGKVLEQTWKDGKRV
jgi:hypothetical protein